MELVSTTRRPLETTVSGLLRASCALGVATVLAGLVAVAAQASHETVVADLVRIDTRMARVNLPTVEIVARREHPAAAVQTAAAANPVNLR